MVIEKDVIFMKGSPHGLMMVTKPFNYVSYSATNRQR